MLKNIFKHFYRFFLYSLAFVILISAILITVIRLTLPRADNYRQQAQDWISQYMNYPVEISKIGADWDSWILNLHLHNVNILYPVTNEQILNIKSILIGIDIFESLYKNEIVPKSIVISGVSLTLIRQQDGSIITSRYLHNELTNKQGGDNILAKWFLAQKNILIKETQLTLLDLNKSDEPLLLPDVTLRIANNSQRTQIEGLAILSTPNKNILNFSLDVSGDVLASNWSGKMYLQGKNINISPLMSIIKDIDIKEHEGTADIKLWGAWNQAKLHRLEGYINLKNLKLANDQSDIYINQLSGNFLAVRGAREELELVFNIEDMVTPNGVWSESVISLKKIYDDEHGKYRYIASANYLNLDDIDYFRKTVLNLSDGFLPINISGLTGHMRNVVAKYNPTIESSKQIYMEYEFSQLGGKINDSPFNIMGLSGHMKGTRNQGNIRLASDVSKFETGKLFTHPLIFYELNTELDWHSQNKFLIINTSLLDTHTKDFNIQLKGELKFEQNRKLPFVNTLIELSDIEINKIAKHLPSTIPEDIASWLNNSLVTGNIPSAKFVFRGWLEDYPFKKNEGIFKGLVTVNQATLDYNKEWPPINRMDAELTVNGDILTIDASSGDLYGTKITRISAVIEDLSAKDIQSSVFIDGHIGGDMKDGLLFIKNSPLHENKSLEKLQTNNIFGELDLNLSLDIPLSSGEILVDGTIFLHDVLLKLKKMDIKLSKLNGSIDFTHNSISAEAIKAQYFKHPVELTIENNYDSSIITTLSGSADKHFISSQLIHYFPSIEHLQSEIEKRIFGSCLWEASITHANPNNVDGNLNSSKKLIISSALDGLSIDLPSPLSKSLDSKPLKLSIDFLDKNRRKINIEYSNIFDGIIDIKKINNENYITTSLSFGSEAVLREEDNQFSVTGNIEHLIIDEWFDLIPDNISPDDLRKEKLKPKGKPVSVNIQVDSLQFMNQNFTDLNIKLNNRETDSIYHLNINAEDIRGDIYLNRFFDKNPVNINLKKLILAKNETVDTGKEKKYKIIPSTIPPLNVEISELIYNNMELGQLKLITSKSNNGLSVDNINFNKAGMVINGSGVWNMINNEHYSKFNLSLNAKSMKTMLETFNYNITAIEKGKTNLSLDTKWQGTPVDFSLDNLNGTLNMKIKDGQFTDLDPSVGRLFGLLSLQALPKRLSLDFADLFKKGFAFDDIAGDFDLENGNAYTGNLSMTGSSANIDISGRIGLAHQDYDQIATVTPKITDSLPAASALFGPVGIGIGTAIFMISEMFNSLPDKIDTLLHKQYSITGAWDDPQIIEIKQ